jgi:hypothetical protein
MARGRVEREYVGAFCQKKGGGLSGKFKRVELFILDIGSYQTANTHDTLFKRIVETSKKKYFTMIVSRTDFPFCFECFVNDFTLNFLFLCPSLVFVYSSFLFLSLLLASFASS